MMIIRVVVAHSANQLMTFVSMVDSTKVLCPLFDKIVILIPGDSSSIFPSLGIMRYFSLL